jgi:hypothetical protein
MERRLALLILAASLLAGCHENGSTDEDATADSREEQDAIERDVEQEDVVPVDGPEEDPTPDAPGPDALTDAAEEDSSHDGTDPCRSGLPYPSGPYISTLPDSQRTPVPEPLENYTFEGYFDDDGDGEITDETWRTIAMDEMLNSCFKHLLIMIATPDCPYCGMELAELVTMYDDLRASGFLVLVLVADRPDPSREFVDSYISHHGLNMPTGIDAGRDVISIFPHGISAMSPKNILIDLETMEPGQCCQDGDPGTPGRITCWLEGYSSLMLDCIEREHLAWYEGS